MTYSRNFNLILIKYYHFIFVTFWFYSQNADFIIKRPIEIFLKALSLFLVWSVFF